MIANGFHKFWLQKFLLTPVYRFLNPSSSPRQVAFSGVQLAACDYKSCSKSRLFKKLVMTCTLGKIDQWQRRKVRREILLRLLEQSLQLISAFKQVKSQEI
jgi:hypothetical protein